MADSDPLERELADLRRHITELQVRVGILEEESKENMIRAIQAKIKERVAEEMKRWDR